MVHRPQQPRPPTASPSSQPDTAPPNAELPPVKVTSSHVIGVVICGAILSGATMSLIALLVVLSAVLVLFDASAAGLQRVDGKGGLLNMNPVGWGMVTALLFVLGWPLYLVARVMAGPSKGKMPLLIGVVLSGVLVFGAVGVSVIIPLVSPPVGAVVSCKGGPTGFACEVKRTSGRKPASACWQVRLNCMKSAPILANACADVSPDKPTPHLIPIADIKGLGACGKVKGMEVEVVSVKARE